MKLKNTLNHIPFLILLLPFLQPSKAYASDRAHFRGRWLNPMAGVEKIPHKWDSSAIKLKAGIHGRGHSSPVVNGNQILATTATLNGIELYALCIGFLAGKIINDIKIFAFDQETFLFKNLRNIK